MKVIIVLAVAFLPAILTQCNIEKATPKLQRSVYEFAVSLATRVAHETENHFVTSPLSLWILISRLTEGTDGINDANFKEIKKTLGLHPHLCFNRKYNDIVKQVYSTDSNIKRSSLLVFDESLSVNGKFIDKVQRLGLTKVLVPSFETPDITVAVINNQVYQDSNYTITDVLTPEDIISKYVLLIDAVNFSGKWKYNFNSEDDEISTFYDDQFTKPLGDVILMFTSGSFNYVNIPQIGAKVLEIPHENSRFSMLILLPDQESTVPSVLDKLKYISLASIYNLFDQTSPKKVMTQIPKFHIETNLDNLEELLRDMGLLNMFSAESSFTEISKYLVSVSDVIQYVDLTVTKEDAEYSEPLDLDLYSEDFNANRPFVYMIVERELQLPVFVGAYSKPSKYLLRSNYTSSLI